MQYLQFEYDKLTNRPLHDQDGNLIIRQNFLIDGINCHPATFALECKELNEKYHKNNTYDEIKSHHYILSFDPKDAAKGSLTIERAQALGMEYAKKNFPGHQTIVCTHKDGESHSGNILVHIILNSIRKEDVDRQKFMERPCDSKAGYKHHVTRDYLKYLKLDLMQTCERERLHQVDLLKKTRNRRLTNRAYFGRLRHPVTPAMPTERCMTSNVIPEYNPTIHSGTKDLHSRNEKQSDSSQKTASPYRPSVRAQLEAYQQQIDHRQSRRSRITNLQHTAQTVAYLQEQGYTSMEQFETEYQSARQQTKEVRAKVKDTSAAIDRLNEQLHHTGRYLTHRKTYNQFLKAKNKAKFRKDYSLAITEYETSRNWLTTHAKDETLPTSAYIETEPGKFPNIKKVKELRDQKITERNDYRRQYNTAKEKERELRSLHRDLEALIHPTSIKKRDEQTL